MKKLLGIVVLGLLLLIINNCSFDSKTYLKCEPYNNPIEIFYYFAFNKSTIYTDYDPINSKFRKTFQATYGERYVKSTNITINREEGRVTITPSLTSIFLDIFQNTQTKTITLYCKKISKRKLPKEKVDKKF